VAGVIASGGMSRTVELRIAGQSYRVVSTAPAAELQRLATVINQRLAEIPPQARGPGAQALVLVAISLAHEAEAERHRRESLTARTRELLEGLLRRIDGALDPPMDATPAQPEVD
jgi:cell division protein ZapA